MSDVRTFGKFEIEILNAILNLDKKEKTVTVKNILENLPAFEKIFDSTTQNKTTYFSIKDNVFKRKNEEIPKSINVPKDTERILCGFVLLMEYLIKKEYLFEIKENTDYDFFFPTEDYFITEKLGEIKDRLKNLWNSVFIVTFKMKELGQNNFEERELHNEKMNNLWTRLIAIVSILVSIASVVVDFFNRK